MPPDPGLAADRDAEREPRGRLGHGRLARGGGWGMAPPRVRGLGLWLIRVMASAKCSAAVFWYMASSLRDPAHPPGMAR